MKNPLTRDLKLKEYAYIVVNVNDELETSNTPEEKEKEKSNLVHSSIPQDIQNSLVQSKQEIYSIKKATQNKSKAEVVELIRIELQIVESDIHTWNNMIRAISRMDLSSQPCSKGEFKYILNKNGIICKDNNKLMTI